MNVAWEIRLRVVTETPTDIGCICVHKYLSTNLHSIWINAHFCCSSYQVDLSERETERERERERETERERERQSQTDRQTNRQTDRKTDRKTESDKQTDRQTYKTIREYEIRNMQEILSLIFVMKFTFLF